jgi:hypothetical protein
VSRPGDGMSRCSEGYIGLSRCRHQRASPLGRLCWIITAQASARLTARKVLLDCNGGVGAPRCSEGYVGLSRRRRRRSSLLRRLCWIVTAQVTARLAARKAILDSHGAGIGAPRRSEGYVGLSRRRRRRSSLLGRLYWIVTAQASALLAIRKVMWDWPRRSSPLGRLCWIVTAHTSARLPAEKGLFGITRSLGKWLRYTVWLLCLFA